MKRGDGRYLAKEPVTAPREPPWTAARTDNEHGRSFGGGAALSATSLRKTVAAAWGSTQSRPKAGIMQAKKG
ncbi:MAG: hypothetical protein RIN56_09730 [Sporomusaceae bacterium]|nr:hypothetical protein [Sporomusaceae bacterium]